MKSNAKPSGRAVGLQLGLLAVLVIGCVFLGWIWFCDRSDGDLPAPPQEQVAVPSFRFFTRADGMPVAEVDSEALSAFLSAFGIPPLSLPPPPIEAAVTRSLHRAMQSLSANRSADSYGRLGQFFDALRMMDQCQACFAAAVRLAPEEHRWRHYLGRHLATQGDFSEAEAQFRRATELLPSYLPTQWRLASIYVQQGRTEEAETILRKTLLGSSGPYPCTELAFLEIQRGRHSEARTLLEEALRRDGSNGRAHALMSQTFAALGDHVRAESHARKGRYSVKSLDPIPDPIIRDGLRETDSVAYHRIAARSLGRGGGPEMVALWERICEADPANADDKIQLANAYFEAGRPNDAIATLEAAIAQEPRGSRFRLSRAQLAIRMNDPATALRFADEAIELEKVPVTTLMVRSVALTALGRTNEAVGSAERALELSPDEPEVYSFLGSIYADAGRIDDAVATYRRGLVVDPESASLQAALKELEEHTAVGT